jgi:hypothetical protein
MTLFTIQALLKLLALFRRCHKISLPALFQKMSSKLFAGTSFRGCLQLLFQAFNSGAVDYIVRHFLKML